MSQHWAVKPTNLQNGSLPDDGGHGGHHHLPQTTISPPKTGITLPTSPRFYYRQAGGGFYNRQAVGGNAHGVGRQNFQRYLRGPSRTPSNFHEGYSTI
jgi:hypothetical protein